MQCLLLTPYVQREVGIAFVRMPKSGGEIFDRRVLVLPAPAELETQKSGLIDWGGNEQAQTLPPEVVAFLKMEKVRSRLVNPYVLKSYVSGIKQCQLRDGEYCHRELTVTEAFGGMIRTCWHHDTEFRNGNIDENNVKALVETNHIQCAVKQIQAELRHNRTLTLSDVVLYALKRDLTDCLPETVLRTFFGLPPALNDNKESSVRFGGDPQGLIQRLAKAVIKLKFDEDPPAQYMLRPKPQYIRSEKWLRWVKSQPCVCCGRQADDPHHLIGVGGGIMGGKADDLDVIPLCREHHNELHRNVAEFERQYGTQKELWHDFFINSIKIGAIEEV